ncbi:MAG: cobyric acid synthase [Candidatus Adiutrix sp.]|jgi:adenosylcobyric acid synthase|nr:cobyric acid synthase [Candidatus Adiutrix sp.]
MPALTLMVVGTASSAGKSLLVTAFCRIFRRRGWSVAPFKAQNMSLNSFVTPEGGEIGRAQASQAEAAGLPPSVLMNPILLKPTTNRKSQVIVRGRVEADLDAPDYYAVKGRWRPVVLESFRVLAGRHQAVIIEGAGSPAEINLMEGDFVNLGLAAEIGAPALLVGDIDRGGVFAALYGTVQLMPPRERAMIKGLVINKFRGDPTILEPGLQRLEELLGLPVLGVMPYAKFALDEEDSLTDRLEQRGFDAEVKLAVVRLPRLSNFTDFAVFDALPGVGLRYVDEPASLAGADLIILPGSKNTLEDMVFLEKSGLAGAVRRAAAAGTVVMGLCAGFQMLGRMIHDPHGVESGLGSVPGLGLLEVETTFARDKRTVQAAHRLRPAAGPLAETGGLNLAGYEIHMGETSLSPGQAPLADDLADGRPTGAVRADGRVFGSYLHGFFDNLDFTRRFLAGLHRLRPGGQPGGETSGPATYQEIKEREYERLADLVEASLPFEKIMAIMEAGG